MIDRTLLKQLTVIGTVLSLAASTAHGATSQFELNLQDLDRPKPGPPASAKKKKPQSESKRREEPAPEAATTGEESLYTIRPGDFIFKILMRDYGLSNDAAERLIPEIQKLNKLANIRNLTVGQKIRIPLHRKADHAEQTAPETPEQQEQPAVASVEKRREPVLPELPASEPAMPHDVPAAVARGIKADEAKSSTVVRSADRPGATESAERIVVPKGTQPPSMPAPTSVDLSRYPAFPAADGGKIVLDLTGSLPADVIQQLTAQQPGLRIVSGRQGKTKQLLGKVLREAGFQEVNEDVSLIFGSDPQVTIDADYRVVMKDPRTGRSEPVLIDATPQSPAVPAVEEFLKGQNVRYIDLAGRREQIVGSDGTDLIVLEKGSRCGRADAILDALKIPVERDRKVDLGGGLKLHIPRVVSDRGKLLVLRCGEDDGIDYMTERLLELEGLTVINLVEDDPEKSALEIIGKFRLTPQLRRNVFTIPGKETVRVEVTGYVVELKGRRILLAPNPVDRPVRNLLARMKPAG